MKAYIRENYKTIISITCLLIVTVVFLCTNELVAEKAPETAKSQSVASVKKEKKQETKYVKPDKVADVQVSHETGASIDLNWEEVSDAIGYFVYKSVDGGITYDCVHVITDGKTISYQDKNIKCNTNYLYKVCAYAQAGEDLIKGEDSEPVKQLTRLATPVLVSATNQAYNTLQVQWQVVDGAVGYQIYRSNTQDGTYECIGEIADGAATAYNDATCECGIDYYYYIKACQATESGNIYGDSSGIVSGKTTPNRVALNGVVSDDETQVALNWSKADGAQGYEVYRSVSNTSNYQLVQKIENPDTLSWTDTGLDKNTEYYYKVRAYAVVNGTGIAGSYSNYYQKQVVIVYDYSAFGGDVSVITQYAGKVPYVWGGKSTSGWDCSGFTYWVYKNHFGVDIGMTCATQYSRGVSISVSDRSAWKPGDILFYTEGAGPSHVAIYLGNGQLIHALSTRYDTLIQGVDYYERWDRATSLIAVKRIFQ